MVDFRTAINNSFELCESVQSEKNEFLAQVRNLIEGAPIGIFQSSWDGQILYLNSEAASILGYDNHELAGKEFRFTATWYVESGYRNKLIELLKTQGKIKNFECQIYRRDRSKIWVSINAQVYNDPRYSTSFIHGYIADIDERKQAELKLKKYNRMFSVIHDMIAFVDRNYVLQGINDVYLTEWNKKREDIIGHTVEELFGCEAFCTKIKPYLDECLAGKENYQQEWYVSEAGTPKYMDVYRYPLFAEDGSVDGVVVSSRDITAIKLAEDKLRESERQYREVVNSLQEVVFEFDVNGVFTFVNQRGSEIFGYSPDKYPAILDIVSPEDRKRCAENVEKLLLGEYLGPQEYTLVRKNGLVFPAIIHSNAIINNGKIVGLRGIIVDISERKRAEEQLRYLTLHDTLTGIYNRAYFEQEMRRLEMRGKTPVGVIVCDVDGLKLVNDTLGHHQGDRLLIAAVNVLKQSFRKNDKLARIGGDEFAVLLPNTNYKTTEKIYRRILRKVCEYNDSNAELKLSISAGFAFCDTGSNMLNLFKVADDNMYRQKLNHKQSARSTLVKTLMKALEARDYITEGHAERLQDMVVQLAQMINLPEQRINDLRVFAQFHDLGKVGIADQILFKKGALLPEEMAQMKEHSKIGYRIAMAAPDLIGIANWVLKHHEWWNGSGYPLGLKGVEIPLECRILSIADAYDSMTSDRPYRKALSKAEAIKELVNGAGTQFDPILVKKFIQLMDKRSVQGKKMEKE